MSGLDALIDGWIDQALSPAEQAELNRLLAADPKAARRAVEQLRCAAQLQALLAPPVDHAARVVEVLAASRTSRRLRTARAVDRRLGRRWRPIPWLAAAALLALALGAWWALRGEDRLATVIALDGVAESGHGPLAVGSALRSGDRLGTAHEARLHLGLPDGSVLRLGPEARMLVERDPAGGTRLGLDAGCLEAEVAHQQSGRPLRVSTPTALVEVVGTRLRVQVGDVSTRLEVSEGRVRFTDRGREATVEVHAGSSAEARVRPPPSEPAMPGQRLWLRSDLGVITEQGAVSRWQDQSGNGNDAVQPDPASRPLLLEDAVSGRPLLRFDGSAACMGFPLTLNGWPAFSAVLVVAVLPKQDAVDPELPSCPALFWNEGTWRISVSLSPRIDRLNWFIGDSGRSSQARYPAPLGRRLAVLALTRGDGRAQVWLDGRVIQTQPSGRERLQGLAEEGQLGRNSNQQRAGDGAPRPEDGSYAAIDLAEVRVFDRVLDPAELAALQQRLLAGYRIASP